MTANELPKVAGLLLAAGGSSRLGRPKQLVEWEGKTLIRRAAEALIGAGCLPVFVVLGAEVEGSRAELAELNVEIVENDAWELGMGSSIALGIHPIATENVEAVLITLCDQPEMTATQLREFIEVYRTTGSDIVAAEYSGIRGVPALFARCHFNALAALLGDKGARALVRSHNSVGIKLPLAAADIDTPADLRRLI